MTNQTFSIDQHDFQLMERCLGAHDGRVYYYGEMPDYGRPEVLTTELKQKLAAFRAIDAETLAKIRARYSLEDELKALRTDDQAYKDYVAACVQEGRDKKQALEQ